MKEHSGSNGFISYRVTPKEWDFWKDYRIFTFCLLIFTTLCNWPYDLFLSLDNSLNKPLKKKKIWIIFA